MARKSDENPDATTGENSLGPGRSVRILMAMTLAVFALVLINSSRVVERMIDFVSDGHVQHEDYVQHEDHVQHEDYVQHEEVETPDVFMVVDTIPTLIGGLESIQERVQYPELAIKTGVEGKVFLQFIVDEKGRVTNPIVVRGIGAGCDEAALEAIRAARFTPGLQRGKAVKVQFSLPINFRLRNQ